VKRPGEVVYLVDDDVSVREAITGLLESIQIEVLNFESAESFLRHERSDSAGCLLLDLQLRAMSGLAHKAHR
jgi:FixJ family two-component response regulator